MSIFRRIAAIARRPLEATYGESFTLYFPAGTVAAGTALTDENGIVIAARAPRAHADADASWSADLSVDITAIPYVEHDDGLQDYQPAPPRRQSSIPSLHRAQDQTISIKARPGSLLTGDLVHRTSTDEWFLLNAPLDDGAGHLVCGLQKTKVSL